MIDLRWFNAGAPRIGRIRLWNLFNRCSTDGHFWGVGLLQIGSRHLLYVGHSGISILFLGQPARHASWREQAIQIWYRVYQWLAETKETVRP